VVATGASSDVSIGIGLDSTTSIVSPVTYGNVAGLSVPASAYWSGLPGAGAHFVSPIEWLITTTNAATFFGSVIGNSGNAFTVTFRY
jgi:hypothetical protein